MSEDNISLYDLLNVSIGTLQTDCVNFGALHALLLAVLKQLDIREVKTRWRVSHPGDRHPDASTRDRQTDEEHPEVRWDSSALEQEVQPDTELRERTASPASPTSASGSAAGGQRLLTRIQTCEDDVSKAMKLVQELHNQRDRLKDEIQELRHQQQTAGAQAETVAAVEKCCLRVDTLEEAVRSLRDTVQKYPDPEEQSPCVTWDVMESALLSKRQNLQKELVNSGVAHVASSVVKPTNTPLSFTAASRSSPSSSPHPAERRPAISGEAADAAEAPSVLSGSPSQSGTKTGPAAAGTPPHEKTNGSERYSETVEALRNISKLTERFSQLEARVAALEEGKVDQTQLAHLRQLVTDRGSQDTWNNLRDQLNQQRALIDGLMSDREKNVELVNDVQKAILQLQADCERLHETSRSLHEDSRQRQSHIEELYKTTEELEVNKADKQMVESEIKADKSALDSKVSRLQFDSATEQLSSMFHELLNKVTGQEQDWQKVIDKLSTEMECKLNRIELDSVKQQLEDRWRKIHEKLQAQGAPEREDAAGIRKQLVDRFHCLSCDRPVVKHIPGPHFVTLPSSPAFPSHKSIRPFTVYALEQLRQHYRSERISELTDCGYLSVSRSCGGSHTSTSASQRRSGLQHMKRHAQAEVNRMIQSEEVDIVGLDGHIYKGRLNVPAIRNTETKLPTLSTKDGMSKTKDKTKCSSSHRAAASPEAGQNAAFHQLHSVRSAQCSRSASSCSGRDWPVSALGCTSQTSITQASLAAESNAEPQSQ